MDQAAADKFHFQKAENSLAFKPFQLEDRPLITRMATLFRPFSCEYHFANLFCWQRACRLSWTLYNDRVIIYDSSDHCAYMPLGEPLDPEQLAALSMELLGNGLAPDFSLVPEGYLRHFPWINRCYTVREDRDDAEYLYDVERLYRLNGKKLHKKRNLMSQFHRACPGAAVEPLSAGLRQKAMELAGNLFKQQKTVSRTLDQEFQAIAAALDAFEPLNLEGIALVHQERVIAFSVFSRLSPSTYDVQFEKSDPRFKGAAQVINYHTAAYLRDKCRYLNREQDLGIEGLRRAKLSYGPEQLIIPRTLKFKSPSGGECDEQP
ncbi:MAG: phosphatidylglycerol lysyltransferase domain-containing protein [Desulfobacteraceae bacterium]